MKKLLSLIIIFLTSLILSTSLYADGIGAYFSGGGGSTIWDYKLNFNTKNYFFGGGFIYDSNLSQDKLFNYRLNLGYDKFIINFSTPLTDVKCNRISLMNTFGFGLIRTEHFRFWFGPQIGLKYANGEYSRSIYAKDLIQNSSTFDPIYQKEYFRFGEINGGLVLGLNFNINDYITIAAESGFRYGYILKYFYMMDLNLYKHVKYKSNFKQQHNLEGFANIGVLYRFNESNPVENKL